LPPLCAYSCGCGPAEQRVGLRLRERAELDRADQLVAAGRLQCGEQAVRDLTGAEREREQQRGRRRPPQQMGDQLERSIVGPVHVVEDHHHGLAHRHALEQRTHGPVRVEALVLQAAGAGRRGRRQHARELSDAVADQLLEPALAQARDVVVQCVDPDRERQLALELGAAADEHGVPPRGRPFGELGQQAGLADARFAADHDPARTRGAERVERLVQCCELLPPPDEAPVCLRYRRHSCADPNPP
jgi:hypothetical protein